MAQIEKRFTKDSCCVKNKHNGKVIFTFSVSELLQKLRHINRNTKELRRYAVISFFA